MNYGRERIYTDATAITADNVIAEVNKAYSTHSTNAGDIKTLWGYYRGKTAILTKTKEIREEINHKINENRAYEIVNFHKGYTFGEPIQYVRRENANVKNADDSIAKDINALNGYMSISSKAACDNELAEWMYVGGTGYRMVLPNKDWTADGDESPFKLYALDPQNAFVVYSNDVDQVPLMGVYVVKDESGCLIFSVYTKNEYFEFKDNSTTSTHRSHTLGMIPIIEYPANMARLGVFEVVLPLLDALDELQSNRMDDIVQFVNSFLAIFGGELDDDTYKKLEEWKTLCLPQGTDAKYLSPAMNQNDVQTLKDDLYQSILTICGVPNRNGGSSTSDTGSAVIMRDGWQSAEAMAKAIELTFKRSEMSFLRLVLRILRDTTGTNLRSFDVEPHFTRRNYENIASKSQVLISMLNNPNIHPELAFSHCGMFADPESAYLQSMEWKKENKKTEPSKKSGNAPEKQEEGGEE